MNLLCFISLFLVSPLPYITEGSKSRALFLKCFGVWGHSYICFPILVPFLAVWFFCMWGQNSPTHSQTNLDSWIKMVMCLGNVGLQIDSTVGTLERYQVILGQPSHTMVITYSAYSVPFGIPALKKPTWFHAKSQPLCKCRSCSPLLSIHPSECQQKYEENLK